MPDSKLRASYSGIGDLLRSEMMRIEMLRRAERVRDYAEATAPVYQGKRRDAHRGEFKASFRAESTNRGGWRRDRAAGLVYADDPRAFWIEIGTSKTRGHHTLRTALYAAAGD